jgi:asparagine synthase (glutamine-hydrolysing)
MLSAIAYRGPDAMGRWIDGPVALGHATLCTTPESLHETQPLASPDGSLRLTFDGRVDNRTELSAALDAKGFRPRSDSDGEIVLRAYECWGEEAAGRILGDFAFALWDGRRRQLFCARDISGAKPFYYYSNGQVFLCGSDLQQLLADPRAPREPNEGLIGEYLSGLVVSREETMYRDVFRLPPAESLVVRRETLARRVYFDLDPGKSIRYCTDAEYADHFRDIFSQAVRCRMRSGNGAVASELSGGVDSSSVVGMAQSLIRRGTPPVDRFETFSLMLSEPDCDERSYVEDAVRMLGLKANYFPAFELDLPACIESIRHSGSFPDYPNGAMTNHLKASAREKGFRVMLTGMGSDEWMTGTLRIYADLLLRLRLTELVRNLRVHTVTTSSPAARLLLKHGFWPLLPRTMRLPIKRVLRPDKLLPYIDRDFAQRVHLAQRLECVPRRRGFASFAQEAFYETFVDGWVVFGLEYLERSAARFMIEVRHPFNDQRLIEFLFAIPADQLLRLSEAKFVLRGAMRGLIPDTIRQRRTKADFTILLVRALERFGGERLFDSMAIASMGWVNAGRLKDVYRERISRYGEVYVWPLWAAFAVDLWFKVLFDSKDLGLESAGQTAASMLESGQ